MGKLPALQFYPGDEFRSNAFGLSIAARGLWFYMRLLMHDSERRGYLSMNGKPIPPGSIAQRCGCTPEQYLTLLGELDSASIPSRTTDGIIFDKAIIEQEKERQATSKRVREHRSKASNASCNDSVTPLVTPNVRRSSSSSSVSKLNTPPSPRRGGGESFEKFWKVYPKKLSKGQAEKAWSALKPDEQLLGKILESLERAKTSDQWQKDSGQFIPYPATWLRAKGWLDEIPEPPKTIIDPRTGIEKHNPAVQKPMPRPPVLDMKPPTEEEFERRKLAVKAARAELERRGAV